MKSDIHSLETRGWIEDNKVNPFTSLADKELLDIFIHSKIALERSYAVVRVHDLSNEMTIEILRCLAVEKALYTKIYMCEKLQSGNAETALLMIPYLGKIGMNQHKEVPRIPSKKSSYPLARDIIARALSKMDEHVISTLSEALEQLNNNEEQLSELIDAIGYIAFYTTRINKDKVYKYIIESMKKHSDNNLITWKFLTCLSAFPQALGVLEYYCDNAEINILRLEAQRSRKLILTRR
ncbi:MAG: hypothetical protein ACRCTA_03930 [Bacilli bacterium]